MSRTSLISNCRTRAVWDRPATGTRLLPWPKPVPVSLGCSIDPLRMTPKTSAPSRPTCPPRPSRRGCPRSLAADDYPRLIPPASLPHDRGCPRLVADEFPPRLHRRGSGCLRHCAADDLPPRLHRRGSGCLRHCAADDLPPRLPRSRGGCLRHCAADDLPPRLPRSRGGCLRHCAADESPLRLLWRRSGCLRHCAVDDLPRPDSSRSGTGRRGSAGNPHPHPVPVTPDRLRRHSRLRSG